MILNVLLMIVLLVMVQVYVFNYLTIIPHACIATAKLQLERHQVILVLVNLVMVL